MSELSAQDAARKLVGLGLIRPDEASDALDVVGNGESGELLRLLERRQILTPLQIQRFQAGETTGYFVGRFKLLYVIAGGTFAKVYRASDPTTGDVVAVKILRQQLTKDPENIRQFHREAKLTEQLHHPNIARMIEVGVEKSTNQHYIAMEFIEGGNLREFIKIRKRVDASELIRLGVQMIEGLRYALSKGVTHRDVKPTNILISASGDVKWVDFGLGGVVDTGRSASDAAQRTVDYAALEKATGAPKGDPRSDIFFIGAVFYELVAGENPLGPRDRTNRMARVRFDDIPSLANREDVPHDVAAVIDKMLAFRPEARYQDYDSLLADLRRIEAQTSARNGAAHAAQPPGSPRVAVVHHSPKVQEILKGKLNRRGFQTVLTTDIGRAATLCKLRPVDCIVIDLDTTGPDGVDQFKSMQRSHATKGGIFLCSPGQERWIASLDSDQVVQLNKPLVLGPVYQAVRALVERAAQPTSSN